MLAPFDVSQSGLLFLEDSESVVLTAYPDVGGVITIGPGLTELSPAFRRIWRAEHGRPLRKGDKITLGEARRYTKHTLAEEFVPAARALNPQAQHVLDGEVSVLWNCGTGAAKWRWAQALKAGRIAEGCKLLLTTAITSAGRVYDGLKFRRQREARLIEFGDYGRALTRKGNIPSKAATAISLSEPEVKAYQHQLAALGYYKGAIDGRAGKGSLTEGAVMNFQRAKGLKVDGVVGPATRAALAVAVRAKSQSISTWGGGAVTTGGAGFGLQVDGPTLLIIAGVAVVVLLVGFAIWNNRGVLLGKRTPV